jgi:hypothetical protein
MGKIFSWGKQRLLGNIMSLSFIWKEVRMKPLCSFIQTAIIRKASKICAENITISIFGNWFT